MAKLLTHEKTPPERGSLSSSAWIRTRDLTIMSRARGANRGEARRTKHKQSPGNFEYHDRDIRARLTAIVLWRRRLADAKRIAGSLSETVVGRCVEPGPPSRRGVRVDRGERRNQSTDVLGEFGPSLRIVATLEPPRMVRSRTSTSVRDALEAGANGYVQKQAARGSLVRATSAAAAASG